MESIFKTYLEQRARDQESGQPIGLGPVITISREFGCPSKLIAMMLTEALNKKRHSTKTSSWTFINKEVVEEAARKLEINPVAMKSALNSPEIGLMKDILKSFTPPYINSFKIKKILHDVINTYAQQGNRIIVGRGSVAILRNRPQTLHVRLQAPVEWRVKEIASSKGMNEQEVLKLVTETDKNRVALIELLLGRKFELNLFDVVFNCSTFPKEEIVRSLFSIMEIRGMVLEF
jgi:cytidylate kinase